MSRCRKFKLTHYPNSQVENAARIEACATAKGGIQVSQNEAKGGIEIRFPGRPEAAVLDKLKGQGWRWSRFSKAWYVKFSDRQWAFANELAGGAPDTEDYGLKAMTDIDGRLGA